MSETNIIRQHMKISGSVQGVGFRYRAKYAANSLGVTGWVRNEWDGTVELEVQGTLAQINKMLTLINQSPYIKIDGIDRKNIPTDTHDTGFHVR